MRSCQSRGWVLSGSDQSQCRMSTSAVIYESSKTLIFNFYAVFTIKKGDTQITVVVAQKKIKSNPKIKIKREPDTPYETQII